jgi:hypothetical protein
MTNKFRYILFSDQTYLVEIIDLNNKPLTIEISGQEIVDKLSKDYAIDKLAKQE